MVVIQVVQHVITLLTAILRCPNYITAHFCLATVLLVTTNSRFAVIVFLGNLLNLLLNLLNLLLNLLNLLLHLLNHLLNLLNLLLNLLNHLNYLNLLFSLLNYLNYLNLLFNLLNYLNLLFSLLNLLNLLLCFGCSLLETWSFVALLSFLFFLVLLLCRSCVGILVVLRRPLVAVALAASGLVADGLSYLLGESKVDWRTTVAIPRSQVCPVAHKQQRYV